jgi:hypothetical protein
MVIDILPPTAMIYEVKRPICPIKTGKVKKLFTIALETKVAKIYAREIKLCSSTLAALKISNYRLTTTECSAYVPHNNIFFLTPREPKAILPPQIAYAPTNGKIY